MFDLIQEICIDKELRFLIQLNTFTVNVTVTSLNFKENLGGESIVGSGKIMILRMKKILKSMYSDSIFDLYEDFDDDEFLYD